MLQPLIEWLTGPTGQNVGLVVVYGVLMIVVGRKSQIDAWCMQHPRWAGLLKCIRGVCPDPFLLIQGIALIVLRRMPTAYQQLVTTIVPPTPINAKTDLAPPAAAVLYVLEHD